MSDFLLDPRITFLNHGSYGATPRPVLEAQSEWRRTLERQPVQFMLRDLEPAALHVAVFSPPVRHPCFYGIDMPSQSELVAAQHEPSQVEPELCKQIGADSLTYLSLDGLSQVMGQQVCRACFDGDYCVPISDTERAQIYADRRS